MARSRAINGVSRVHHGLRAHGKSDDVPREPDDAQQRRRDGVARLAERRDYLTAAPVNPLSWPPLFAVMAQGDIQQPSQFNLLVLYQPPTGAVGVTLPIVVEQMPNLDFDNAQATVAAASALVRILTSRLPPIHRSRPSI